MLLPVVTQTITRLLLGRGDVAAAGAGMGALLVRQCMFLRASGTLCPLHAQLFKQLNNEGKEENKRDLLSTYVFTFHFLHVCYRDVGVWGTA